jgi:hypothetical protein
VTSFTCSGTSNSVTFNNMRHRFVGSSTLWER